MAVDPRKEPRPPRERLRGYLLALPVAAGFGVLAHRWVPESWSASVESMLFGLLVAVGLGEFDAWRIRRANRRSG